jgi:hypothetical protein
LALFCDAGSGGSKCTFFPGGFSGGEGDSEFAINRQDGRIGDGCAGGPGEEALLSKILEDVWLGSTPGNPSSFEIIASGAI